MGVSMAALPLSLGIIVTKNLPLAGTHTRNQDNSKTINPSRHTRTLANQELALPLQMPELIHAWFTLQGKQGAFGAELFNGQ
jgi:hypothetical protein